MSRRIEFTTNLTNADLLVKAFKRLGYKYSNKGPIYSIDLPRGFADINTVTGKVSGDEDFLKKTTLQKVYQAYSEEEVLEKIYLQGATVESREVDKQGNVIILCRLHG